MPRYLYIRYVGKTTEYGPRDEGGFQYVFVHAGNEEQAEKGGEAACEPLEPDYYVVNWYTLEIPNAPIPFELIRDAEKWRRAVQEGKI